MGLGRVEPSRWFCPGLAWQALALLDWPPMPGSPRGAWLGLLGLLVGLALMPGPADAGPPKRDSNNYYRYVDGDGVIHITNRPQGKQGAWKLYRDAEAKYHPCHDLEAYLDARGFRWRHEPRGLVVIGATDAESFSPSNLTPDEKAQIRVLVGAVRAAYDWPADKWDWPNTYTPENT